MSTLKSLYRIIPEENLVIEYHTGILEVESYIDFKKRLHNDPLFRANLNHFIHYKSVVFKTTPSEINHFTNYINSISQNLGHRKTALVTNTPNQVVSTTMYKMMQKNPSQNVEVFSTNHNAFQWLNCPNLKTNELNDIILELSKQ